MKKSLLLLAASFLSTQAVAATTLEELAVLSFKESEDLMNCAQHFKLVTELEVGEDTGLEAKYVTVTPEGNVRVYKLIQGDEFRGNLQIDIEGDVSQIDDAGNLIANCN